MTDLWSEVRSSVLYILGQRYPTSEFEERVMVAEEAARNVQDDAKRFLEEA